MDMVVVGVVFLDIKGFPFFKYDAVGTNLGNVLMTHGGVARNVAVNMANLGAEVEFVTMLDDDSLGREAPAASARRGREADARGVHAGQGHGHVAGGVQ